MVAVSAAVNLVGIGTLVWGSKDDAAVLMAVGSLLFFAFGGAVLWDMRQQRNLAVDTRTFRFARSRCLQLIRDEARAVRRGARYRNHPETTVAVQKFRGQIRDELATHDAALADHVVGEQPRSTHEADLVEYLDRVEGRLMGWDG